jgi:signal transduction protein with GAF and PtsI domain
MAEDLENHTLRLLQEMRAEMHEIRSEVKEMRDDLTIRLDGNTLILNMVAGLVNDHEQRIDVLETREG